MPYYCTVPRCTSMAGKAKNVSFHQFPRDEELASLWNKILKRGKPYTKYSKVCSLHFRPEDYTITSVGKNKGQWRTLRKDAIPSQNLPLESPGPSRVSAGYWVPNHPTTMPDPQVLSVQQHVAQAIYLQTMLATQAAANGTPPLSTPPGNTEAPTDLSSNHLANSIPDLTDYIKENTRNRLDVMETPDYDKAQNSSYQCQECSKCFKDPDVFVLHRRTHKKCDERLTNNLLGKENFNVNADLSRGDTLKENPILANLLKTGMSSDKVFDVNNILSIENQIMAALAVSMESYIQNLTTLQAAARKKDLDDLDSQDNDDSQVITNERDNEVSDHDSLIDGNETNEHYNGGEKGNECPNGIDNISGDNMNWSDVNRNSYQEYEKYVVVSANDLNHTESDENHVENVQNHVENDQNHVENDQNHVENDQNYVGNDQNYVVNDQNHVKNDQNHIDNDQNHVENDQNHVKNDQNHVGNGHTHVEFSHIDFIPHDQTLDSVIEPNCDNQDLNESKDSNLVVGEVV